MMQDLQVLETHAIHLESVSSSFVLPQRQHVVVSDGIVVVVVMTATSFSVGKVSLESIAAIASAETNDPLERFINCARARASSSCCHVRTNKQPRN